MIAECFCVLVLSVICDLKMNKIPNVLMITGLVVGLLIQTIEAGPPGLLHALLDGVKVFGVTFLLFLLRAIRGGDGKLLTLLAVLLGWRAGIIILILSLFYGGILGIFKILGTHNLYSSLRYYQAMFQNLISGSRSNQHNAKQATTIHYSLAILLATIQYLEGWY